MPAATPGQYPLNTGPFARLSEEEKKKRLDAMVRVWQSDTERRIEREGYRVVTAGSGAEALRLFAEKPVDLAVVDHYMPEMSGDVLAAEMRRMKAAVPIVLFSGSFSLPEMVIALVDGFVSSSNDHAPLLHKIAELLPLRKAGRAS